MKKLLLCSFMLAMLVAAAAEDPHVWSVKCEISEVVKLGEPATLTLKVTNSSEVVNSIWVRKTLADFCVLVIDEGGVDVDVTDLGRKEINAPVFSAILKVLKPQEDLASAIEIDKFYQLKPEHTYRIRAGRLVGESSEFGQWQQAIGVYPIVWAPEITFKYRPPVAGK